MAQASNIQRTSNSQSGTQAQNAQHIKNTSKAQTSATFQQLLQREGSKWSHISTDKLKKNNNEAHNGNHHNKKSVLAKVKEKAKKLKHSLSIKKHRHEKDPPCTSVTRTPITCADEKGEENAQFHGARNPASESKHIQNTNKHVAKDHPREAPIPIPEKHSASSKDEHACSSNTIKDTDSNNGALQDTSLVSTDTNAKHQVPSPVGADTDVKNQVATTADVTKEHDSPGTRSRFSKLTVSTSRKGERSIEEGENMKRGVSVKEYLMQKFEPGEDERALSQIITQTISPRRDKVREAMSVFLKNEEPSTSKVSNLELNSSNVDDDTNPTLKSKSLPASIKTESKIDSIVQSHSLGSNASKNLNQTFKSIVASYQNNVNSSSTSSSPNKNAGLNDSSNHLQSPTKPSPSPLGHACGTSDATSSRSPQYNNASTSRVPTSRNRLGVVEEENDGRILQEK